MKRFWVKVQKTEGCWLWTASNNNCGYGLITYNGGRILAHRLSWELHNGAIPEGLFVLHRCDTPPCVRPDHLFLGTYADNAADKVAKGRASGGSRPGESHHNSKLTAAQVLDIRSRKGQTHRALAKEFGVARSQIYFILSRKQWRHI